MDRRRAALGDRTNREGDSRWQYNNFCHKGNSPERRVRLISAPQRLGAARPSWRLTTLSTDRCVVPRVGGPLGRPSQ
jgi:hypothetical protein